MKMPVFSATTACLVLTGTAGADFIVSSSRAPDTTDNGYDIVEFFARDDGTNGTGTKAIASDITLKDLRGGRLLIKFVGAGANDKADLVGAEAPVDINNNIKPDRSFINILGSFADDPTAYSVVSTNPPNTHINYAGGVPQFEVAGANLSGGVNATTSNGGKGALIAVAVVPTGDVAAITGSIGGDTGDPFPIYATNPLPEPATLGLLSVGALLLTRRRRHP